MSASGGTLATPIALHRSAGAWGIGGKAVTACAPRLPLPAGPPVAPGAASDFIAHQKCRTRGSVSEQQKPPSLGHFFLHVQFAKEGLHAHLQPWASSGRFSRVKAPPSPHLQMMTIDTFSHTSTTNEHSAHLLEVPVVRCWPHPPSWSCSRSRAPPELRCLGLVTNRYPLASWLSGPGPLGSCQSAPMPPVS